MVLSFISVPIVLRSLGAEDYGLYALVAGVVAMLAFLNSSMTVSTQRYLSVTMGTGNVNKVTEVFSCSLYLHLLIGLIVCVLFEIVALFAFDGFLNISQGRVETAKIIYQFLVLSTFFTIISVPYDAALNAHENMLVFSIITIIGALLRLSLAVSLLYIHVDKLILYGAGLACISLIEVLLKRMYVAYSYSEMKRKPFGQLNKQMFKEMFSFAGWNMFGAFASVCRNQGVAVVLNLFFGTIVNAAYGVANQVNGVLLNFSGSLQKAINPQLMKNKGAKRSDSVLNLTFLSIEMSVLIFALMAIPLIIEMRTVLMWWLKAVPDNTIVFCQLILISNLITQMSAGIMAAIQANGNVKWYQFIMGGILILNLPISFVLLYFDFPPYSVLVSMCIVELVALAVRLLFAYRLVDFPVVYFLRSILFPLLLILIVSFLCAYGISLLIVNDVVRLGLICIMTLLVMLFGTYFLLMTKSQREKILRMLFLDGLFASWQTKKE